MITKPPANLRVAHIWELGYWPMTKKKKWLREFCGEELRTLHATPRHEGETPPGAWENELLSVGDFVWQITSGELLRIIHKHGDILTTEDSAGRIGGCLWHQVVRARMPAPLLLMAKQIWPYER